MASTDQAAADMQARNGNEHDDIHDTKVMSKRVLSKKTTVALLISSVSTRGTKFVKSNPHVNSAKVSRAQSETMH